MIVCMPDILFSVQSPLYAMLRGLDGQCIFGKQDACNLRNMAQPGTQTWRNQEHKQPLTKSMTVGNCGHTCSKMPQMSAKAIPTLSARDAAASENSLSEGSTSLASSVNALT